MPEGRPIDDTKERLVRLETQVARIVSDAESEKDTRKRVNTEITRRFDVFDDRFRKMEKTIWISTGGFAVLMIILNVWLALK